MGGEPILHVSACARALTGCAMLGDRTSMTGPCRLGREMKVETRNSVAYRLALVADGSFDATVSPTAKRDWDLAAADVILREAGGTHVQRPSWARRLCYNRAEARQSAVES